MIARILASSEAGICPDISPADEMFSYPIRLRGASPDDATIEYFRVGHETFAVLDQAVRWAGGSWAESRVLDFASGYGRVSRFVADAATTERMAVADILAPAVAFQETHLGVAGVVSATAPAAVDIGGPYDVITVISLFSHLPDKTFRAWLAKLALSLADGGLLLISTAGEHAYSVTESAGKLDKDFVFWRWSESRKLKTGDYGKAFCRPEYVQRIVDRLDGVAILARLPHAINNHQDLYVLGRGRPAPAAACIVQPVPSIHIDVARREDGAGLRVQGWALSQPERAPVTRVTIYHGEQRLGTATLGGHRPDLAVAMESEAARGGGFAFAGPGGDTDSVWLSARAEDERGQIGFAVSRLD